MIQAQYNARAINKLKQGKAKAWSYIKTMPKEYQLGAIGAVQLTLKRKG